MATTLTGNVNIEVGYTYSNDNTPVPLSTGKITKKFKGVIENGAGAGKAQKVYHETFSIAASGTLSLDLAGVLLDPFGVAITFTKVKTISFFLNAAPAAASILIGGAAMNGFVNWVADATDKLRLRNGPADATGVGAAVALTALDATGFAVTAGTGDAFLITNESGSLAAEGEIIILGEGT